MATGASGLNKQAATRHFGALGANHRGRPRVIYVHVQIEKRNLAGGWDDVSGAEAVIPVP